MISFPTLAWVNLSLPLFLNVHPTEETRPAMCFAEPSELKCDEAKCHNLIDVNFNNISNWSCNITELYLLPFKFNMILPFYMQM